VSKRTLLPFPSSYSPPTVYFLFGTAAEIPIVKRLVKVESEANLDQDSGAIGTMEFLQKGKYTEETQNSVDRLLHLVVSSVIYDLLHFIFTKVKDFSSFLGYSVL
jgi:hypothetical protein